MVNSNTIRGTKRIMIAFSIRERQKGPKMRRVPITQRLVSTDKSVLIHANIFSHINNFGTYSTVTVSKPQAPDFKACTWTQHLRIHCPERRARSVLVADGKKSETDSTENRTKGVA